MRIIFVVGLALATTALVGCQEDSKGRNTSQTSNGVPYIKHTNQEGAKPQPGEYVYFHAYMRDGDKTLVSTQDRGVPAVKQVPAPSAGPKSVGDVLEVLQLMSPGDSATLFLDMTKGSSEKRPPGLQGVEEVSYDIVLLDILSQREHAKRRGEMMQEEGKRSVATQKAANAVAKILQQTLQDYKSGELGDKLKSTPSGLEYVLHREGTGTQAAEGRIIKMHYYGAFVLNGQRFDSSYKNGKPLAFVLGDDNYPLIPGWEEGVSLFKEGAEATLIIPSELGYGKDGQPPKIPANSDLAFHIKLLEVK